LRVVGWKNWIGHLTNPFSHPWRHTSRNNNNSLTFTAVPYTNHHASATSTYWDRWPTKNFSHLIKEDNSTSERNLLGYNNIGMGEQPNKAFRLKKSALKRLLV
jgi:hypothetical protein